MSRKRKAVEAWALVMVHNGLKFVFATRAEAERTKEKWAEFLNHSTLVHLIEAPSDAVARAERAVVKAAEKCDVSGVACVGGGLPSYEAFAVLQRAVACLQKAKQRKR